MKSKKTVKREKSLELFTKAKSGNVQDIEQFCSFYKQYYPNNTLYNKVDKSKDKDWKRTLHTMYIHLSQ